MKRYGEPIHVKTAIASVMQSVWEAAGKPERRKRQRGSAVLYVRMAATAQVGESGKVAGDGAMHEMPQTDCRGDCEA